ncbi:hypothetical protein C8J57DRAFT_1721795 [Mycena rebaudengoi]|nr:hypothetical protein C8J57DRAFT_1721795 [Mycena rebaudengoi]
MRTSSILILAVTALAQLALANWTPEKAAQINFYTDAHCTQYNGEVPAWWLKSPLVGSIGSKGIDIGDTKRTCMASSCSIRGRIIVMTVFCTTVMASSVVSPKYAAIASLNPPKIKKSRLSRPRLHRLRLPDIRRPRHGPSRIEPKVMTAVPVRDDGGHNRVLAMETFRSSSSASSDLGEMVTPQRGASQFPLTSHLRLLSSSTSQDSSFKESAVNMRIRLLREKHNIVTSMCYLSDFLFPLSTEPITSLAERVAQDKLASEKIELENAVLARLIKRLENWQEKQSPEERAALAPTAKEQAYFDQCLAECTDGGCCC